MRIQYKASYIMVSFGLITALLLSVGYETLHQKTVIDKELQKMKDVSNEVALHLESHIEEKIAIAATISSAPLIKNALLQSNAEFAALADKERKQEINSRDDQWIKTTDINDPFLQTYMTNHVAEYLRIQLTILPGTYGEIFLTNRYGVMIATTNKLTTLAHSDKYWWIASYADGQGRVFLDDRGYDASSRGYVLGVTVPVKNGKQVIGILKCNVNVLGPLTDIIKQSSQHTTGKLKVTRSGGLIVTDGESNPLSTRASKTLVELWQGTERGTAIITENNEKQLVAFSPVKITMGSDRIGFGGQKESLDHIQGNNNEGWHVSISHTEKDTIEANRDTTLSFVFIGMIFTLLTTIIALILGKWVARPIVQLATAAQDIGDGNLDARVSLSSNDEIGLLAKSLNKMAGNLKDTMISRDGLLIEIEQRKQAEKLVRKLSQAIEQAGESIVITNREGIIEYTNPAFTKLSGYSTEEAIGQTPGILNSHSQSADFYDEMWKTITSGQVWHGKIVDKKKDGSFYPAMLTISPINDQSGDVSRYTHFVGIQSDLTQLEEMEQQFYQSQKMEAIGTLVGGIAHDFNNMLAGITGNLYLAKRKQENPDTLQKLDNIEQLSLRAADMIKQLLTFARKDKVEMKALPFTSFIKETFQFLHSSVPENIEMQQDVCSDALLIHGDITQLHQILMNLINNAHDAVEGVNKPCITIKLEAFRPDDAFTKEHTYFKLGQYAHLSIGDNGCGIPKHRIEHLFEPFFTTKEQGKGTGLGLAMVFGAVKTHQGFVEVESIEGEGSTFHIFLPLVEQAEVILSLPQDSGEIAGRGEMILLADDEQHVRETTAEVLETMGYRVLQAEDGLEAVEVFKAHQNKIGLVILDLVMPHCGGVELAERIREISPAMPVLFVSGYDMDEVLSDGKHIQNSNTLSKPVQFDILNHAIRSLLEPRS